VQGDDRAGPFSILILQSTRSTETTPPAVQIDFPTDVPFFALTVSRPALAEEMRISLLLAASEPYAPETPVQPFKLELNMDEARYAGFEASENYLFGENVAFSGDIYFADWPYYEEEDVEGAEFMGELGAAVRNIVRIESEEGYLHDATLSMTAAEIPFLDGISGDIGTGLAEDDEIWVSRYRRTATSWEHLNDLTFAAVEGDGDPQAFRGKTVAHVSLDAETSTAWSAGDAAGSAVQGSAGSGDGHAVGSGEERGGIRDLSILFPLAFPAYISLRRLMLKATRSSRAGGARRD
jgi:hypothetical protein